jgi:flavin reductase (DIM6/NTAB) family NADH-FMN oxidoreductase RutF
MADFRSVPLSQFSSLFDRIGKQWMLISATDGEHANSMTASWGSFGILWGKPVAICFIRPQRHTFTLTEQADRLSLTFFDEKYRGELTYMGRHSGKDGDKYAATGLSLAWDEGVPYLAQADVAVICRKLYAGRLNKQDFVDTSLISAHYPDDDYHQMYVCEIERVLVRRREGDNT